MTDLLIANRDGGQSDEFGTFLGMTRLLGGSGVIEGLAVEAQSSPNMTVQVEPGTCLIPTGTYPTSYAYWCANAYSGGTPVTIGTANTSNPRIDYIVVYVDISVTPIDTSPNNPNSMFLLADVEGTASSSPVVPTTSQIQTTIGASNPYMILYEVAVAANVTQIDSGNLTDLRTWANIGASNLSASAITLGSATATSDASTSSTTAQNVIDVTVTVPPGGRNVKVTGFSGYCTSGQSDTSATMTLWNGTVGTGTQIASSIMYSNGAGTGNPLTCIAFLESPAAGSYTFSMGLNSGSGSSAASLQGASNCPILLLVELI